MEFGRFARDHTLLVCILFSTIVSFVTIKCVIPSNNASSSSGSTSASLSEPEPELENMFHNYPQAFGRNDSEADEERSRTASFKFCMNLVIFGATIVAVVSLLRRGWISLRSHTFRTMLYIFAVFFIGSCVIDYHNLRQEAKAENRARLQQYGRIPYDCNYDNFVVVNLLGYFIRVSVFKHIDECRDYLQMLGAKPVYVVDANAATADQLKFRSEGQKAETKSSHSGEVFNDKVAPVPNVIPLLFLFLLAFGILVALIKFWFTSPFVSIRPDVARENVRRRHEARSENDRPSRYRYAWTAQSCCNRRH